MQTFEVSSDIGMLEITPTAYEGVVNLSVRCNNAIVRSIRYTVGVHMKGDTGSPVVDKGNVWIRRPDKKINHDMPSDSARGVIMAAVERAANWWWATNEQTRRDVLHDRMVQEADAQGATVDNLRKQLAEAEAKYAEMVMALRMWEANNTITMTLQPA
jgi:hypothetical protein